MKTVLIFPQNNSALYMDFLYELYVICFLKIIQISETIQIV